MLAKQRGSDYLLPPLPFFPVNPKPQRTARSLSWLLCNHSKPSNKHQVHPAWHSLSLFLGGWKCPAPWGNSLGKEEAIARHWGDPAPSSPGATAQSPPGNCAQKWIPISLLNHPVCCHSQAFVLHVQLPVPAYICVHAQVLTASLRRPLRSHVALHFSFNSSQAEAIFHMKLWDLWGK